MNYKLMYHEPDFPGNCVAIKLEDGVNPLYIVKGESNSEYQKYLDWLAEGNEPLPADE
jgi:hypothetical protein